MKKIIFCFITACSFSSIDYENNQNAYDAVYVINLDRTPERFNFVKEQLNKEDIKHSRFRAVDGYEVKLMDQSTGEILSGKNFMSKIREYTWKKRPILYHINYSDKYKDAEFDLFIKHRKFSAGEIGVIYSHRAIWKDILKKKYKTAIIFEDDVILLKKFKKNLVELINNIPPDSDITFIGVGRRKDKSLVHPNIDSIFRDFDHVKGNDVIAKIQPTNLVYGMYAYIVGAKGAQKLLELTNHCEYPVDDIIFQQGGINKEVIKAYVAKKKMCFPFTDNSEIKNMGRPF
ncbi:MAG: glycosyltransferase family 25 protein [Holosporaceae bacterium]|jgi:GR25 family glycosyltransferase involved in LPS biosynthesis|nr:glycosyltransferase family 25 protein [Holosporaceae bacterium]